MQHRHLEAHVGYAPVAVEDILDRGKPEDWVRLRDVVLADPYGAVAQTVLEVCANTYLYGTSILWTNLIQSARASSRNSML